MDVMKKVPVREQAPDVRNKNFDEVCLGYNKEEAMEEATRCLNCKNARCVQGCPVSIDIPAFIHQVKEGNTDEYKKMVKFDIGSIIYSKSGTEIPVQLSSGKYVLKYIHPASGKIETINKSLKINGLYNLKVPDKKEGIYWFHKL